MKSRGGNKYLNTDSSLDSIKLSTNYTSHRGEIPQLIKVQEIKYL